MSKFRSIVYVSTALMPMEAAPLEELLVQARALNHACAVTGVLLSNDGNFMQYFEGSHNAVQATWDRIRLSRRHTGIIQLLDESIGRRCFGEWLMGFGRATDSDLLTLSTADWGRTSKMKSSESSAGLELLKDFWQSIRPSASN